MEHVADCVSTEASSPATLDPRRCQFSFADGRHCRLPRCQAHPALCISHARAYAQTESQPAAVRNIAGELAPLSGEFRTATDVNHVLGRLFSLLAQNRIPRRNAVALGYLAQLLLQTLPGVRSEMTRCLGYEAWDETLESVFPEHQTEEETEEDQTEAGPEAGAALEIEASAEDKSEDHRGASLIQPGHAEPAPGRQPAINEKDVAPTQTDPAPVEIPAKPKPQESPEPEEFVAQLPGPYNYWKELEQNEHLRKTRH